MAYLTQITGNVATLTSDAGNPVKTGGVYNSSAPAPTNGQRVDTQADGAGNTLGSLGTLIFGEDPTNNVMKVEGQFTYSNITTTTTTTVHSGQGLFHALIINTPVASSVITIYDNTAASGTKIATITLPATLLQEGPYTAIYDVKYSTGLTIVTGTAASDITVSFR